jgi:hypothetical protein
VASKQREEEDALDLIVLIFLNILVRVKVRKTRKMVNGGVLKATDFGEKVFIYTLCSTQQSGHNHKSSCITICF